MASGSRSSGRSSPLGVSAAGLKSGPLGPYLTGLQKVGLTIGDDAAHEEVIIAPERAMSGMRLAQILDWTAPGAVDKFLSHAEARSKASRRMPPR